MVLLYFWMFPGFYFYLIFQQPDFPFHSSKNYSNSSKFISNQPSVYKALINSFIHATQFWKKLKRTVTLWKNLTELQSTRRIGSYCKGTCIVFDGSQQTTFKQKFENNFRMLIFQSSFVPLQLICSQENKIIWRNSLPFSPRFCRPIRIRFVKDITNEEIIYVENQINCLEATQLHK